MYDAVRAPAQAGQRQSAPWLRAFLEQLDAIERGGSGGQAALDVALELVPATVTAAPMLRELAALARASGDLVAAERVEVKLRQALTTPAALHVARARVTSEEDLLRGLAGKPIGRAVRTLFVVGAHRYQEGPLFDAIFPHLDRVVLFEPLPALYRQLSAALVHDRRISVLPYAISDSCGDAAFHLTDNDAASSSLLRMKRHRDLFPHVHEVGTIRVPVRTLPAAVAEHRLPLPQALVVDVQGAEHRLLAALGPDLRAALQLVYTEASTEEVYDGARDLGDVASLLEPDFQLIGFSPLSNAVATHGNALFVRRGLVLDAIAARPA